MSLLLHVMHEVGLLDKRDDNAWHCRLGGSAYRSPLSNSELLQLFASPNVSYVDVDGILHEVTCNTLVSFGGH